MNLAGNLVASARAHPGNIAIRLDETSYSYDKLDDLSRRVATCLAVHGLQPDDRIAIMLPNVMEWAALYYGALRAGAVVVPMNPLLKQREIAYHLLDSGAKVIFAWQGCAAEVDVEARKAGITAVAVDPSDFVGRLMSFEPCDGVADRQPNDTAVILYTSGTTGLPKGAELTHANLDSNVEVMAATLHVTTDDVIFGGLPLFHVFGQTCALNVAVRAGATLTQITRFDPAEVLDILVRDRVTVLHAVPTMFSALLSRHCSADVDLSALRVCISGGSALPVEVLHAVERTFGCVVLEGYGLSETSPAASFNHLDRPRVPGSIGTPLRGVEMQVVDDRGQAVIDGAVGEIVVRGRNVMKGYWNKPEATAAAITVDGWFHTGDLGRVDENGNYFIVDRKKDMIIRGGYNVYPREIEEVLYEHPDVGEAAVVGVVDDHLGEEIAAAVALKPGASATAEQLRDFVKARVAAYKYPRSVHIVDALPKGPTGKILKREITLTVDHQRAANDSQRIT
jgi:long-chain acyl-CoA synthetase